MHLLAVERGGKTFYCVDALISTRATPHGTVFKVAKTKQRHGGRITRSRSRAMSIFVIDKEQRLSPVAKRPCGQWWNNVLVWALDKEPLPISNNCCCCCIEIAGAGQVPKPRPFYKQKFTSKTLYRKNFKAVQIIFSSKSTVCLDVDDLMNLV
jgi:hypothetical protein